MTWQVALIIERPIAKTLTIRFHDKPEDREVFRLMRDEGAISAQIIPPLSEADRAAQADGRICACEGPHRAGCTAV